MKTTVRKAFDEARVNLKLDQKELDRAIAVHNEVTAYLTAIVGLIVTQL